MPDRGSTNPYVAGPPITGEYGFYDREDLVENVVNKLKKPSNPEMPWQNVIVLHGQRRIGKTSLLYRLWHDKTLRQDHIPIFFDLQLHSKIPFARLLANLAQTIADELQLKIPLPTEVQLVNDFDQFRKRFLREIFPRANSKRLLFLFDEFDEVVRPDATDLTRTVTPFGNLLQTLIEKEAHRIAFIFVVGQRQDLLTEDYTRHFKSARSMKVGRLNKQKTEELLKELGQQGQISYADEAVDKIWALTNGHPYLTQLIGSTIFEYLQQQKTGQVFPSDVGDCLDDALKEGLDALDWFWRGFSPKDQWVLSAIADLAKHHKTISDAEIEETLKRNLLSFVTESVRGKSYRELLEGDFLERGDVEGQYRFAVEFIRYWISENHPIQEAKREMEDIPPKARNYYKMGLDELQSDNFTEAINNFNKAIELSKGKFALAYSARAQTHEEQEQIPEAIKEYETAYQLELTRAPESSMPKSSARESLIKLRLKYARSLANEGKDEQALDQIEHILQIENDHSEARQLLSDIYLRQASKYLENDHVDEAKASIQKLVEPCEPRPIIQDPGIGQRVRDLWLGYSQKLCQQQPPNWDKALEVLESLRELDLLDATVRVEYNQIVLAKVEAFLTQDRLYKAVGALQNELKSPFPPKVKKLLLQYSKKQINQQCWPRAEKILLELRRLIPDAEGKEALLDLYQKWGEFLRQAQKSEKADKIFLRGEILEGEP